jgi:hydroxymethylglutaryl-CoA synthase
MKLIKDIGIVSYGSCIPRKRIKVDEIAKIWEKDGTKMSSSLGVYEKSVPDTDEDTITLAVNASQLAIDRINHKIKIRAIYVGSESHPYAVKPTSAIVGEALGINHQYTAADLEFACKAGSAAMQIVCGMVSSELITHGLAVGSDTAQSKPNDPLEYSAAAAASAFIIGTKKEEIIAKILYTYSFTSDTPDFWRRENQMYPTHAGRFTGKPAYFKHILHAIEGILKKSGLQIPDFSHVVLHMPNGTFPKKVAKKLGISNKQMEAGFIVPYLGNSYSACSLTGLSACLDLALPNEKILFCSYGSGSGSDAFIFETTDNLATYNKLHGVQEQMANKNYISYIKYAKILNKIKMN